MEAAGSYGIVIIGGVNVGKTALFQQFLHKKFPKEYKTTSTSYFLEKKVNIDGENVPLKIWDTAGEDRFQTLKVLWELENIEFRRADCCLLLYDITNKKSFQTLDQKMEEFKEQRKPENPETFPFIVIGTKADKVNERKVDIAEVEAWCKSNGNIPFYEISLTQYEVVKQVFEIIARAALKQPGWKDRKLGFVLKSQDEKKDSDRSSCCK